MKIEYRKGDLLTTEVQHILHGCNRRGVMGSGVAKAIRDKYPQAYTDYNDVYNSCGLELGTIVVSVQDDGTVIHNAITQIIMAETLVRSMFHIGLLLKYSENLILGISARLHCLCLEPGLRMETGM